MSRQHKVTNASVNNLTTTDFHVVRGAAQAHTVMSVCVCVSLNPLHYGKQRQMGRQSEPEGEKKHRQCSCFHASPLQPTENGNIYVSFVILLLETTACLCIMTKQEVNPVITSLTPLHRSELHMSRRAQLTLRVHTPRPA